MDAAAAQPRRLRASDVPAIVGLRLSPYGAPATLVNISPSGMLVECTIRLKVDAPVQVAFDGDFSPKQAAGRIARCEVAAMGADGLIRYHIAIAFTEPIPLEGAAPPATPEQAAPPAASVGIRNRW